MLSEKRNDPRTKAKGLEAKINVFHDNGSMIIAEANLINVSRSGLKLRVKKPLLIEVNKVIQIEALLPQSNVPVIVNAVVVRNEHDSEFGIQYIDARPEDPLENLIIECQKLTTTEG